MKASIFAAASVALLLLLATNSPTPADAKKGSGHKKRGRKQKSKTAAGSRASPPPRRASSGRLSTCPPGTYAGSVDPAGTTDSPRGTTHGYTSSACPSCPINTYTPVLNSATSCTSCPSGTTTPAPGSSCCVGADQQQCTASPGGICLPWASGGPSNCTYPVPPAPTPPSSTGVYAAAACDGANLYLSCPSGTLITGVVTMFYGRFDATTCAPGPGLDSTTCAAGNYAGLLDLLTSQCRGQASCSVPSSSWYPTFGGDPCYGVAKALRVHYSCSAYGRATVCDAGTLTLACQSPNNFGISAIADYNGGSTGSLYGRASTTTCYGPGYANTGCRASDAALQTGLANLWSTCRGQPSCTLGPSAWSVMGDPCPGTVKYLDTSFLCAPLTRRTIACDGSDLVASCADVGGSVAFTMRSNWGDKSAYGQAGGGYCPGPIGSLCGATDANVAQALNTIQRACGGQQSSCTVPWAAFSASLGPDPCYGTVKYLIALYACV